MRFIKLILCIVPACIGFLCGLILSPFVVGYLAAQELVGDFMSDVADARLARLRQKQEAAE